MGTGKSKDAKEKPTAKNADKVTSKVLDYFNSLALFLVFLKFTYVSWYIWLYLYIPYCTVYQ